MIDGAFRIDPSYGYGVYRRRIRLVGSAGRVSAGLEDTHHAMASIVTHDDRVVTDVIASLTRIPMSTCPGASEPIRSLIGTPLSTDLSAVRRNALPRLNCTHLFDLTCLAITQAARGEATRQYDIEIEDERSAPANIRVWKDDVLVHDWQCSKGLIVAPQAHAGRPIMQGFMRWATNAFSGEALEAAIIAHQGYFVSRARRFLTDRDWLLEPAEEISMTGVCHTYQPDNARRSLRLRDVARDFTHRPEDLLASFDPDWDRPAPDVGEYS